MKHLLRGLLVVGFGFLLMMGSGCGGGQGVLPSPGDSAAALPARKGEITIEDEVAEVENENVKLARRNSRSRNRNRDNSRRRSATGSIRVETTPSGAQVYLDGVNTGRTTTTVLRKVSPGPHTVRVVLGAIEAIRVVAVEAGRRTKLSLLLRHPTVDFATVAPHILDSSGGSVVFNIQAFQSGVSTLMPSVTLTRSGSTFAVVPLTLRGSNLYSGAVTLPRNNSTISSATYGVTFSVDNGITNPRIIPGGNVTVEPSPPDTPPPLPQL